MKGGVPRPTKKPRDMEPGDDKKVGAYVHQILKTDFAGLQGDDQKKCADEALVKAVQTKMRWDKPPAKEWLFTVLCQHRAQAEAPAAEPKRGRAPGPQFPSPPPKRRVKQALGQAGIGESVADDVAPAEHTARTAAVHLARKRGFGPFAHENPDREKREKQIAAMLRAGHTFDHVRAVLDAETADAAEQWAEEAREETGSWDA